MKFAPDKSPEDHAEAFLVCGLGRLGQQCATLLKEFGVRVIGVDIYYSRAIARHSEFARRILRGRLQPVGDFEEGGHRTLSRGASGHW